MATAGLVATAARSGPAYAYLGPEVARGDLVSEVRRRAGEGRLSAVELEGFHAVKHALRFGAPGLTARTDDRDRALALCGDMAPDLLDRFAAVIEQVEREQLARPGGRVHPTRVAGRADRPPVSSADLAHPRSRPVVHLHRPVDPGNVGAVVRVAAAVGAAGVTVSAFDQLWSPACLRGSAGLHYALPVLAGPLDRGTGGRAVVALDPAGVTLRPAEIDPGSVLVFGSERHGLPPDLLGRADRVVALPMAVGVSSLNLATAVAATTYALAVA